MRLKEDVTEKVLLEVGFLLSVGARDETEEEPNQLIKLMC